MKRLLAALALTLGISFAQGYAMVEVASYGEYRLYVAYDLPVYLFTLSPYVLGRYSSQYYDLEAGLELIDQDWRITIAWNSRYGTISRLAWVLRWRP